MLLGQPLPRGDLDPTTPDPGEAVAVRPGGPLPKSMCAPTADLIEQEGSGATFGMQTRHWDVGLIVLHSESATVICPKRNCLR